MRRLAAFVVLSLALFLGVGAHAQGRPVARTILALYDGQLDSDIRFTAIHQILEMPLNHLGLVLTYHEIGRAHV